MTAELQLILNEMFEVLATKRIAAGRSRLKIGEMRDDLGAHWKKHASQFDEPTARQCTGRAIAARKSLPPHRLGQTLGFFHAEEALRAQDVRRLLEFHAWEEGDIAETLRTYGLDEMPDTTSEVDEPPAATASVILPKTPARSRIRVDASPREMPRRDFIKAVWKVAAWSGAVMVGGTALPPLRKSISQVVSGFSGHAPPAPLADVPLDVATMRLFRDRDESRPIAIYAGNQHPGWPIGRHPSNALPADTTGQALSGGTSVAVAVIEDAGADLLSFGSTISNDSGRDVFTRENWLRLPYYYINDESQRDVAWRYAGGKWYSSIRRAAWLGSMDGPVPAHSMWDANRRASVLADDILLVTAIPNPYDRDALVAGGRVVFVGGVQGVATESFPRIITDGRIYNEIMDRIGDARFFQAAIRVGKITHTHRPDGTGESVGSDFSVLGVEKLDANLLIPTIAGKRGWKSV